MGRINLKKTVIEKLFGKSKNETLEERIKQIIDTEGDKFEPKCRKGEIKDGNRPGVLKNRCIRAIRRKRIQSRCNYGI